MTTTSGTPQLRPRASGQPQPCRCLGLPRAIATAALALGAVAATAAAADLRFLDAADASRAFVLDSTFDPTPWVGELDPPYEPGADRLVALTELATGGRVAAQIDLDAPGTAFAFALSPDGDTAIVLMIEPHGLVVVRGLAGSDAHVADIVPLAEQPLSAAFAPDGRSAAIGQQRSGAGHATLSLIDGLPDAPRVARLVGLGIEAAVLSAVESVDFGLDGRRLLVQTALHDEPAAPGFFLPRVALQVVSIGPARARPKVSEPLWLPATPALPPAPPFGGLDTGVALGDSAIGCDGETAVVPVSGALDLGQPDARVLLVEGIRRARPRLAAVLTPADGVGIAPLQVARMPDCRALLTNVFSGTATTLTWSPAERRPTLASYPLGAPFPAEPAATADGRHAIVHHPRVPLDGVPPALVTVYTADTMTPAGPPVGGPVRAWVQVKDSTLAVFPPGLVDLVRAATAHDPDAGMQLGSLVRRAIDAAAAGQTGLAAASLARFDAELRRLERHGVVAAPNARAMHDLARVGLRSLQRRP